MSNKPMAEYFWEYLGKRRTIGVYKRGNANEALALCTAVSDAELIVEALCKLQEFRDKPELIEAEIEEDDDHVVLRLMGK